MCEINSSRGLWPSRFRALGLIPRRRTRPFSLKGRGRGRGGGASDRLTALLTTVTYRDHFISDARVSSNDPPTPTPTPQGFFICAALTHENMTRHPEPDTSQPPRSFQPPGPPTPTPQVIIHALQSPPARLSLMSEDSLWCKIDKNSIILSGVHTLVPIVFLLGWLFLIGCSIKAPSQDRR